MGSGHGAARRPGMTIRMACNDGIVRSAPLRAERKKIAMNAI
jgi:hypothetical protein